MLHPRGLFELYVLAAILKLGERAYGAAIHQELTHLLEGSYRKVAVAAVYTTLHRLAAKRFVESTAGGRTTCRGGRSKKFYKLKLGGRLALSSVRTPLRRVLQVLESVWTVVPSVALPAEAADPRNSTS